MVAFMKKLMSISDLKTTYRKIVRGGLRIGFHYRQAEIWNAELGTVGAITLKNILTMEITSLRGKYLLNSDSPASGNLTRRQFWYLLKQYTLKGYRQIVLRYDGPGTIRERASWGSR